MRSGLLAVHYYMILRLKGVRMLHTAAKQLAEYNCHRITAWSRAYVKLPEVDVFCIAHLQVHLFSSISLNFQPKQVTSD